ncbi:MAG: hypothetical protein KDF54_00410 [Hydrogenophaga sp.]|nr:hypothetical protein [Hydrogenophaga sp.]
MSPLSAFRTATPALVLGAALFSGCASADGAPGGVMTHGGMLTGANGMTLYTFDKDPAGGGKSVCNGPCATNWPPLMASGAASGDYSVITRDDGGKQLAYKGKPLYYWIKDTKAGDTTGDGFNGVWHVAKP